MKHSFGLSLLIYGIGLLLVLIQTGHAVFPDVTKKSAIVRVWLKSYMYPYKLKANRDWCNPDNPNEPCSPAFHLCFIQSDTRSGTCDAQVKFGGQKTQFASRNIVRFGNNLASGVSNPIEFYIDQWKPYPSLNITVTNGDYDTRNNLIAKGTMEMAKLDQPALTKWRAKWHKVTLRLARGKMRILIYYQAYEARSPEARRQAIRLHLLKKVTEPVAIDLLEEDLEETVDTHAGGETKIVETPIRAETQLKLDHHFQSTNNDTTTEFLASTNTPTRHHTHIPITNTPTAHTPNTTSTSTTRITTTTKSLTTTTITTLPMTTTEATTTTGTPPTTTASTTITTTPYDTTTATTTNAPHQLSNGAIVGLACGLGLLVFLLILAGVLSYKYRDVVFAGYRPLDQ